jgi:hypothetical protein
MEHSFGHDKGLPRPEFRNFVFQVDQQFAFDDVEKLVIVIVLVPVIFAFDHSESHYGSIHLTKRLVVPLVRSRIRECLLVDQLQRFCSTLRRVSYGYCVDVLIVRWSPIVFFGFARNAPVWMHTALLRRISDIFLRSCAVV